MFVSLTTSTPRIHKQHTPTTLTTIYRILNIIMTNSPSASIRKFLPSKDHSNRLWRQPFLILQPAKEVFNGDVERNIAQRNMYYQHLERRHIQVTTTTTSRSIWRGLCIIVNIDKRSRCKSLACLYRSVYVWAGATIDTVDHTTTTTKIWIALQQRCSQRRTTSCISLFVRCGWSTTSREIDR